MVLVKGQGAEGNSPEWVNSVQLLFSFWAPYLFSFVVVGYGYQTAWLTGGLYTAVFILPIALSRGPPAPQAEAL